MGGDGGVAFAEANVSDNFVGGVVNIGEDTVDSPGERSITSGVCGVDGLRPKGAGRRRQPPFRSFS